MPGKGSEQGLFPEGRGCRERCTLSHCTNQREQCTTSKPRTIYQSNPHFLFESLTHSADSWQGEWSGVGSSECSPVLQEGAEGSLTQAGSRSSLFAEMAGFQLHAPFTILLLPVKHANSPANQEERGQGSRSPSQQRSGILEFHNHTCLARRSRLPLPRMRKKGKRSANFLYREGSPGCDCEMCIPVSLSMIELDSLAVARSIFLSKWRKRGAFHQSPLSPIQELRLSQADSGVAQRTDWHGANPRVEQTTALSRSIGYARFSNSLYCLQSP